MSEESAGIVGSPGLLGPRPAVCLSLTESTIADDLEVLERNRDLVDVAEVRIDFLDPSELPRLSDMPARTAMPLILVFRRREDGGVREIAETERCEILARALSGGWRFVDLELDCTDARLRDAALAAGATVIRSAHSFSGVPEDPAGLIRRLSARAGEIAKIAVMPHSTADLYRIVVAASETAGAPKIVVGMGPWGFPTRILSARLGSALTYCSAGRRIAAPGHVDPQTLASVYHFHRIGAQSSVFAVVGNPVLHSKSPAIHNQGFVAADIDAVYLPVQVDDLRDFFRLAEALDIRGASVTIPHKQDVIPFLAKHDPSVAAIGACNTVFRRGGEWHGTNTDRDGFLVPLLRAAGGQIAGMNALVVGAGGSARAVVSGLTDSGCNVTVVNRTPERARLLAERFSCAWGTLADGRVKEAAAADRWDVIVQTTSVGMSPDDASDPLAAHPFRGNEICYDLVYTPEETPFLKRAALAGCRTIGGRAMLLEQAYRQFEIFTGRRYPS